MESVVELSGINRSFVDGSRQIDVLKNASLELRPGEFVAIVGPSGAGKSSILNIVSGLDIKYSGRAKVLGHDLQAMSDDARSQLRNQKMGFVFQAFHLLSQLSVLENVSVPAWINTENETLETSKRKALHALSQVGLEDRAESAIGVLSGGERQRIAIARAIANDPVLILADEPTGNLDGKTAINIIENFDRARRENNRAVLVVTHDERVSECADRVLKIEEGRLQCD